MNDKENLLKVLGSVTEERVKQVSRYGQNDDLEDGTGPDVAWLYPLSIYPASGIEQVLRDEYEENEELKGKPTWMHLIREEVAEAFQEDDQQRLEDELVQVAALCVSWVETLRKRRE